MEKINLNDSDWEALLPEKVMVLGRTKVSIKPVPWVEIPSLLNRLKPTIEEAKLLGITADNYTEPENISKLTQLVTRESSGVISELCPLREEDIIRLPLSKAIELVMNIIDVNIESQKSLLKNLQALVEKIKMIGTPEGGELETSSNS